MATVADQRAAFGQVVDLLQDAAVTSARALTAHAGTAAGQALDRQLEHALDRLALLYGQGTYENLGTADIVHTAAGNELRIAAALADPALADPAASAASAARARSLIDAARRGARLHVRDPGPEARFHRGVYIEPLRPEVERWLWHGHQPYLRWRDGAVLIMDEAEAAELRAGGEEVRVLFLDADELLDLDAAGDRPALEAELARRLAAAQAAPDGVGDDRERFVRRMLLRQSTVLRNLRDRLAGDHPSAHAALLPLIAGHREHLQRRLVAGLSPRAAAADPLGAAIAAERDLRALVTEWAGADDPSGLRARFRAVAEAGTRLPELERHHG